MSSKTCAIRCGSQGDAFEVAYYEDGDYTKYRRHGCETREAAFAKARELGFDLAITKSGARGRGRVVEAVR